MKTKEQIKRRIKKLKKEWIYEMEWGKSYLIRDKIEVLKWVLK